MKKFLTVLLVIAVMFTFSFSSAFATVNQGGVNEDKDQYAVPEDFLAAALKDVTAGEYVDADFDWGTLGVTTQERAAILDEFDDAIDAAEGFDSTFGYTMPYGTPMPNKTTTNTDIVEGEYAYIYTILHTLNDLGHNTTPTDVKQIIEDVAGNLSAFAKDYDFKWDETTDSFEAYEDFMSNAEAKELTAVWTEAKATAEKATTAAAMKKAQKNAKKAADKITAKYVAYEKQIAAYAKLNVSARLLDGEYLLENYGRFTFTSLNKKYPLASLTPNEQHAVMAWLLDNGYTTKASFEEGTAKLVEALVPYKTWSKDYQADLKALGTKIKNVNQSLLIAKSTETKLADVAALYDEIAAFEAKYAVTADVLASVAKAGIDLELVGIASLLQKEVANTVLADADAIKALNKVKNTMTDAEVTEAIALANGLYANFNALYEDNATVIEKIYPVKFNMAALKAFAQAGKDPEMLAAAYEDDIVTLATVLVYARDLEAFKLLARVAPLVKADAKDLVDTFDDFTEVTVTEKDGKYSYGFDKTAKNIAAIADAREAVDTFFATYGDLVGEYYESTAATEYMAARLLAAEYNEVVYGIIDPKPTATEMKAAQAILDNATVKVTTQALGNGKIRVQAKLDDDTWAYIKGDGADKAFEKAPKYTVEYKFYKKKAADKAYKGYSDKTVNYTVFKKLTKGTKYNFRCAVTLKDKNGNVVATRAFTGSTKATRTAK